MASRLAFDVAVRAPIDFGGGEAEGDLAPTQDIAGESAFLADVLAGLSSSPKSVPARWFYDRAGSELFEEITRLPEYYPTRVETGLLEANAHLLGAAVAPGRAVVEFGSGSSTKTPQLLTAIAPSAYVPIDISGDFLRASAAGLARAFPSLPVLPVEANFMHPVRLPREVADLPKLGFFPGSTIGNLVPRAGVDLLRGMIETMGEGALLLIGMDRVKSVETLVRAYDDAAGVTARFNLNLLERINRELDGDVPVASFRHRIVWSDFWSRIEMHLEASRNLEFTVAGRRYSMRAGETIHTENSHKYSSRTARQLLAAGGWTPTTEWLDDAATFSLILAEACLESRGP